MNHYEELGLDSRASAGEIHQAYRNMIRILHPDQYRDERLKLLAECQVKRINEVVQVLSDPVRRRQYDLRLLREGSGKPCPSAAGFAYRRPLALAAALAALAATLVVFQRVVKEPPAPSAREWKMPEAPPSAPEVRPAGRAARPRSVRTANPQAQRSRRVLQPDFRAGSEGRGASAHSAAMPLPPVVASPPEAPLSAFLIPTPTAPAPSSKAVPRSFSGEWVYVPCQGGSSSGDYSAEFIELRVVEERGRVAGRYWARHRIKNRPISGEVLFEFQGGATGETIQVNWTGNGGAEGSARLKLVSESSILIEWWTTRSGIRPGLTSGTATLLRP